MARDSKTLERRNKDILAAIQREQKRNPKWQYIYIIEEVAKQFYLKPSTIVRIISTGQ